MRLSSILLSILVLCGLSVLTGCTLKHTVTTGGTTIIKTVVVTPAPTTPIASPTPFVAAPAQEVPNVAPGGALPAGYVQGDCPYISNADAEPAAGTHIYLSAVTQTNPVSCLFWYYSAPYYPAASIEVTSFSSAVAAHNAMVQTAALGLDASKQYPYPNFEGSGADLISYEATFTNYPGGPYWACAFAKGNTMVVIRTSQNLSKDALNVAKLIVGKF